MNSPTPAKGTKAEALYSGPDAMSGQMLDAVVQFNSQYVKLAGEIAAASGDRETAITNYMATSDDAAATKLRNQIEELTAKFRAHADKTVQSITWTPEQKAAKDAELEVVKKQVRDAHDGVMSIAKAFNVDVAGVADALKSIGDPTRTGRGRTKGEEGSQLPRPRVFLEISGGNYTTTHTVDSFSKLGTLTGIDVKQLQIEYAKAAKVPHDDISKIGTVTVFEYDTNDATIGKYSIKVTPKSLVQTETPATNGVVATETSETADSAEVVESEDDADYAAQAEEDAAVNESEFKPATT